MKRKVLSVLLLGLLSMLFAEIFSGSSQLWFIDPFAVFLTLPLYMFHTLFLLIIAFRTKRTNIRHLYWLGVLFGLYEAVITKVLWQGYMHEGEPALGTILGVAAIETPILIFFWHPIFSFILPILTYEILSNHLLDEHQNILKQNKKKNLLTIIIIITISTFIVSGNGQDLIQALIAFFGTLVLVLVVYLLSKRKPLAISAFKDINILWIGVILIGIYTFSAFVILPENFPKTLMPYMTILFLYLLAIVMFVMKPKNIEDINIENPYYSKNHLIYGVVLLAIWIIISTYFWSLGEIVLNASYWIFTLIGISYVIVDIFKHIKLLFVKDH